MQYVITSISIGSIYALIAVGFALIFSVMNLSNFSHGSIMAIGAYIGYLLVKAGINPLLSVLVTMFSCAVLAAFIELVLFRRIRKKSSAPIYLFVASVTLLMLLTNVLILIFGGKSVVFPSLFEVPYIVVKDVYISKISIVVTAVAIVLLLLLEWFLFKTKYGIAIRAAAQDRRACSLMGCNVDLIITLVFALAGLLGGCGGFFLGISYSVYPRLGNIIGKAFVATVIGGMGSIKGAIIGAFILGIVEVAVNYFFGSVYVAVFVYAIAIAFMIIRPQGIAGVKIDNKA